MKKGIHPDYHKIKVLRTDGTTYETRSTWGKEGDTLHLDIDNLSHPAWTGQTRSHGKGGQMDRFQQRYGDLGKL